MVALDSYLSFLTLSKMAVSIELWLLSKVTLESIWKREVMWDSCGHSEEMTKLHQELALMIKEVPGQGFMFFSSFCRVCVVSGYG